MLAGFAALLAPFAEYISPELATLVDQTPDGAERVHGNRSRHRLLLIMLWMAQRPGIEVQ